MSGTTNAEPSIRGRAADEALELLRFYHNKGARLLESVVKSAMGNAELLGAREPEDLVVVDSRVDGGPIMKRIMPRARGTAYPIKRRYSHIRITLSDLRLIERDGDRVSERELACEEEWRSVLRERFGVVL